MNFPESITVTAIDTGTGLPVSDVALLLELKARRKNNYYVGPFITDANGRAQFTQQACRSAVEAARRMFVMDHSGDLESCLPTVTIALHPPEHVEAMTRNYADAPEFWGMAFDNSQELFAALPSLKNSSYLPSSVTVSEELLLENHFLILPLQKR